MQFNEFWSVEYSDLFLDAINDAGFLSQYNSTEFYLMSLSLGENKELTNLVQTAIDNNSFSALPTLFAKKFSDRWSKIQTSLNTEINAFQTSFETISTSATLSTESTNNFDFYSSENNETSTKDKLNTENDSSTKTGSHTRQASNNINFDRALKNFLRATNTNLVDIILNDLLDFLTIDIY